MNTTRALATLLASAALCGCSATAVVSQSTSLADAGIAYSQAAQDVLPLTRERYLDWQSDSLLEELEDRPHCTAEEVAGESEPSADCKAIIVDFDEAQAAQEKLARSFSDLADHARALGSYFQSLKTLAEYDSATSAENAAGRAIGRIDGLSDALESESKVTEEQRRAWAGLAGLVGDAIKAAKLRSRLKADAAAIGRAIDIQDGVLKASTALLGSLDEAARQEDYLRNVRTPYVTGSISSGRSWMTARAASLTPAAEVVELRSLGDASAQLRDVWEDILSGSGSPQAAQRVFDDLARTLDALNAARHANASADGQ